MKYEIRQKVMLKTYKVNEKEPFPSITFDLKEKGYKVLDTFDYESDLPAEFCLRGKNYVILSEEPFDIETSTKVIYVGVINDVSGLGYDEYLIEEKGKEKVKELIKNKTKDTINYDEDFKLFYETFNIDKTLCPEFVKNVLTNFIKKV